MIPEPKLIFIGGTGRSGTNITKDLIARHSEVATLPFEYRFLIDPSGLFDFYNSVNSNWSPYFVDFKVKQLENFLLNLASTPPAESILKSRNITGSDYLKKPYEEWELDKWIPGYSVFVEELIYNLVKFSYRASWPGLESNKTEEQMYFSDLQQENLMEVLQEFFYKCIHSILAIDSKSIFVEDNTWNILYAQEILNLCPHSQMVHVVRDPRDVIASLIQQRWTPDKLDHVIQWYTSIIKRWEIVKSKIAPDKFMELRLEDLVNSPRTTTENICDFLSLDFQKQLLNIDLNRGNIGRWKKDFTLDEQAVVSRMLAEMIDRYGYEKY